MAIDFPDRIAPLRGKRENYLRDMHDAISFIPESLAQVKARIVSGDYLEAERLAHAVRERSGALGLAGLSRRLHDLGFAIQRRMEIEDCIAAVEVEYVAAMSDVAGFATESRPIEWRDAYSVGVPELDRQHQGLFILVGQLAAAPEMPADTLHEVLSKLADYATAHFAAEENYLRKRGSPELAEHAEEHTRFVSQIATTCLNAMYGPVDQAKLIGFLHRWLVDHILGTDQPHLRHCLDSGGSANGIA